jgi:hypothetical protein
MDNASERMKDWLSAADTRRAEPCLQWLYGHLSTEVFDGSRPLRDAIDCDTGGFLRLLKEYPPMCKAIERTAITHDHSPDDIRLVHNVASMFHVLTLCAIEASAPQATIDALNAAHEGALRQALLQANMQIDRLCRLIIDIWSFLGQLALGDARFILIEMPSGNSMAVKLLARLLGQRSRVEIVRASLSRKHVKPAGITRRELLAEQLEAVKPTSNDVVVYLDEWETGTNFNIICGFLKKLLPKGTYLFAAAFQTDVAARHERYASFCADRDKLMSVWGVPGERFRKLLPPLPSTLGGGYFFFSEHDRTAGYRKAQLHGSSFSSFDETVELLHCDEKARRAAAQIILGERNERYAGGFRPRNDVVDFLQGDDLDLGEPGVPAAHHDVG